MRTLLTLEKYDRGMLLEKREQWARSWTQQLWELLYIAHAQIAKAAPRIATDILGQQREIDSQANVITGKEYKSTLAVGAPSGAGGLFCPTGSWQTEDGYEFSVVRPTNFIRGELVGIQAGAGTSAVIPTDARHNNNLPTVFRIGWKFNTRFNWSYLNFGWRRIGFWLEHRQIET